MSVHKTVLPFPPKLVYLRFVFQRWGSSMKGPVNDLGRGFPLFLLLLVVVVSH